MPNPSAEFNKPYNPKEVEDKIYRLWEKSGYFNPDKLPSRHKKPFTIMMAPPNITGHIHIGHALENISSDILIRQKRMQGRKTLFLPGKDHAGIAAQHIVDRELRREGKNRFELGKEKFLERMWQWMEEYGDNIDNELKKLGLSCDWSRKRFTMDEEYQKTVSAVFSHYFKKGWIYKGKRIINWCSKCRTGISDLEVDYKEENGKLWHIKYPIKCQKSDVECREYITVATSRPETLLGDAAVAVHPKDERYKNLVGEIVILPIQNREIPIIADSLIDKNFGTGAVKVTPAHDALDFEIAQNHKLTFYNIINEAGKMNEKAGPICEGLSVSECRRKVIEKLKEENLLIKEEDYIRNIGVCDRCKTVIEPLLSDQWFLKMKELAQLAIKAIQKNRIKFVPATRKRIMIGWFKNIKDWNISRQLWWGHKIPIEGVDDVLDTWFSSALWPLATLGWPPVKNSDFYKFYPTALISSAREIFFLWIARMVFSGLELTGKIPFEITYTHPTILDKQGKKMSKSLGNVVDPMDLIDRYGTDATRFGLIWQATGHQDIRWDEAPVLAGKKFCNKIWNASRFVLIQTENSEFKIKNSELKNKTLTPADKKILKQLAAAKKNIEKDLNSFRFGQALRRLYGFFWSDFCDIYLEKAKKQISDAKRRMSTKKILFYVLSESLKLLHPFMPFITEEIWQQLPGKNKKILMIEKW